ncbi:MAG: glycosyltransferase family 2 protein [Candidatus Methylacidiphilales bacterium]
MPEPDISIPAYHLPVELKEERHRDVVFIFVYNEAGKIARQLERFPPPSQRNYDVMIGDDAGSDGSVNEELIHRHGLRGWVRLEEHGGLSTNIRAGLHWMLSQSSYRSIIMMNGNNKDDPSALPRFVKPIEDGYDYVQGCRFMDGGSLNHTPWMRYLAIRLIHAPLFSLAARHWMSDTTNGFRAFSRRFLEDPRVYPFQSEFRAYEIEQYLAWKALRLGMRCKEISVARDYPAPSARRGISISKIKPGSGHLLMMKPLLALLLGRYR